MATINKRNVYDNKDSLELGIAGENNFEDMGKKEGWLVIPASRYDNMRNHIDYTIKKDDEIYDVDVKGLKRVSRSDSRVQDDKIWIEFANVNGNEGWLFGKADMIAFETKTSFKIVRRKDLIQLVGMRTENSETVDFAYQALYNMYTRKGRSDVLTMIKSTDLDAIIWQEWKKDARP